MRLANCTHLSSVSLAIIVRKSYQSQSCIVDRDKRIRWRDVRRGSFSEIFPLRADNGRIFSPSLDLSAHWILLILSAANTALHSLPLSILHPNPSTFKSGFYDRVCTRFFLCPRAPLLLAGIYIHHGERLRLLYKLYRMRGQVFFIVSSASGIGVDETLDEKYHWKELCAVTIRICRGGNCGGATRYLLLWKVWACILFFSVCYTPD